MCANVYSEDSSSPAASSGRSLLSRLTSPLRSRSRNLADFHIQPFEPHRKYSPGDTVKGLVVLTVVKPIRITHLTIALHGFVRVFKTPNGPTDPPNPTPLTQPGNGRKSQYFGNGYASLFEDEVTLCGEGRLEAGVYEFEFELDFPTKGLPSSIDFERGSITYSLRATITRPTSISATTSYDRKVSLIETVDIGPLIPPKPRIITLEPISRRSRKHTKTKLKVEQEKKEGIETGEVSDLRTSASRPTESPLPDDSASRRGSADQTISSPRSPINSDVQSETSGDSVVSSSTGASYRPAALSGSHKSGSGSGSGSGSQSHGDGSCISKPDKTITATIELLRAGCLPGDTIPLRITIQHTKRVKSLHGIIITLYRQSRIDSSPPLSLFSDITGKEAERLKHEEYYPKSKTGLGGLSLTSAGSSSVFRKDLSQTFAPIIIDPKSLSTVVSASLRVPEDVFPTITGVPGEMISFRYHIEVVLDLGGKLSGQQGHLPRLGMMSLPSLTNPSGTVAHESGPPNMLAAWGGNIVNTDHIRREKSVVACLFEIVVGTTDSARLRGRGTTIIHEAKDDVEPLSPAQALGPDTLPGQEHALDDSGIDPAYLTDQPPPEQSLHPNDGEHREEEHYENPEVYEHEDVYAEETPQYPHPSVPLPELQPDESLTEKERLQQAEQRLLPSQPPEDSGPSTSRVIEASAPEDLSGDYVNVDESTPRATHISAQAHPGSTPGDIGSLSLPPPSAPRLEDLAPGPVESPSEDKQELERRRLMAEASSPADFPDDDDNAGEGGSGVQHEASAPALPEEDDIYEDHYGLDGGSGTAHEALPRYER